MDGDREAQVARHYGVAGLGETILDGLRRSGIDLDALTPVDLAPVDEFHIGGRAATAHIVGLMDLPEYAHVLDVGSGLGGVARYLASEKGCRATGVDLTPEFVEVARILTDRTGLADLVDFEVGSALDLPWSDARFDAATTFHVAMNIADRPRLYGEIARVLRPGGVFAVFDVMRGPGKGMVFPVPWAETAETSFLTTPADMRELLDDAGFEIIHEEVRTGIAIDHHRARLAELAAGGAPPPLGLHLLQGETAGLKSRNMLKMLEARQILSCGMIAGRMG